MKNFLAVPALLIAAAFFLPVAIPSLFGWMNGLLAVPVFIILKTTDDAGLAILYIRNGLLIAAVGALLLGQLMLVVFGMAMLPLAYSLYRSTQRKLDPVTAGAWGAFYLGASWFLFWAVYGLISGTNPYTDLLAMLDGSFARIIEIYRNNSDLSAEVLYQFEQVINGIRQYLPRVLPGFLIGSVIITAWLNQIVSHTVLLRVWPDKTSWPRYSTWQLPDKLIWLVIVSAILSLTGSGFIQNAGYSLIIVTVILYFFQGMAVFIHLLDRWKVPPYLRIFLYIILAIQSYGLLLLSMVGIADIWLNFRKLAGDEKTNTTP